MSSWKFRPHEISGIFWGGHEVEYFEASNFRDFGYHEIEHFEVANSSILESRNRAFWSKRTIWRPRNRSFGDHEIDPFEITKSYNKIIKSIKIQCLAIARLHFNFSLCLTILSWCSLAFISKSLSFLDTMFWIFHGKWIFRGVFNRV